MPHLVMVVDDDHDIREALGELLVGEGYEVLFAIHGEQALALLEGERRPRLILLDLMMPVMNGYEFREEQRRRPEFASIPIVVMTAGVIDSRSDLGSIAVLQKPMDTRALMAIIDQYR